MLSDTNYFAALFNNSEFSKRDEENQEVQLSREATS
jgi:hypothetical protein